MNDVFISYARSTAKQAQAVAQALRGLGYGVWLDDELPAHRSYSDVIEERLKAAKAVLVIWSAEAAKSHWVRAEANAALEAGTLAQLTVDGVLPPMPFNQIQCADLAGWAGDTAAPGWRKIVASLAEMIGAEAASVRSGAPAPPPLPSKPSLVVLPFANLSGDPEQEYFADGMLVEIVEALSRISSIFVIASGSSLSFRGKGVSAQEAARQLGVRFVLEGSIRKSGGRVRVGVQLIDASDGAQIWTHRFEDTLEDVFALQDKVAISVAGKIEPTVQEAEIRRASARPTENMGSYDLFLRGLSLMRTFVRERVLEALKLANRAVVLDPDYGRALSLAGTCHFLIDIFGWSTDLETNRRQGIELAHRALKVAGDDAWVLAGAANVAAYLERDFAAAVALADRATALSPGSSVAWVVSGQVRVWMGETALAIEHVETAMRLDPMGPSRPSQALLMAMARFQQGRFAEAVALFREFAQKTDGGPTAYAYLVACYGHLGQQAEALQALVGFRSLSQRTIDDYARSTIRHPAHLKLFLDGIALAEGETPAEVAGGSGPA